MISLFAFLFPDFRIIQRNRTGKAVVALLTAVLLAGCAVDVDQRGHIINSEDLEYIRIGTTSKSDLINLIGSPTVVPLARGDSWYYVGSSVERFAFYKPAITERQIVAFSFDQNEAVAGMEIYSLEDGREIAFIEKATPSRGRNLGIIEEIFGNIGRFTPAGAVPQR